MTDKKTVIAIGTQADALLANPLLKAVFEMVKQDAIASSLSIPGFREDDVRAREMARLEALTVDKIRAKLETLVSNGQLAKL